MAIDVGIQLFSVRDSLSRDPEGTFTRLAELGFTRVEGANHQADEDSGIGFGISADRLRRIFDETGVRLIGSHLNPLRPETLPAALDFQAELGSLGVGCDIEFYPYGDLDYVKRRAEVFNLVGRLCAERGMTFYYHNHFQEFQEFEGRLVYDVIMENTDPAVVKIELDTYWAYRGGQDALDLMARYGDRVILAHQKDFPADAHRPINLFDGVVGREQSIDMALFEAVKVTTEFTEIGTGVLPIQDLVDAFATLPHFEYLLLEQDHSTLPELDSVAVSRAAFSRFRGVSFA